MDLEQIKTELEAVMNSYSRDSLFDRGERFNRGRNAKKRLEEAFLTLITQAQERDWLRSKLHETNSQLIQAQMEIEGWQERFDAREFERVEQVAQEIEESYQDQDVQTEEEARSKGTD